MPRTARELLGQTKYDPIIATLVERLGADATAELWVRAETRLEGLLASSGSLPKAERAHVEGYVYPTCALYLEMGEALGREEAYAVLAEFAARNARTNRRPFERLCRLPGGPSLLVRAFSAVQPRAFGESAGFEAVQDPATSSHVHFEITECPYHRHTAELDVPEVCNLFCTNDDIIYSDLPGVRFTRRGTLGRGAGSCDFDLALAKGIAEEPRRLLVMGPGVIGSYLVHVLCAAGHDVTVLARGAWADTMEGKGLRIRHYLQRKDTVDHPRVVRELPLGERFDAAFAVMRQDQMVELAPRLSALDTPYVVCVGNDLHTTQVERDILAGSASSKQVLFGFQGTAGHREDDRAVVVRLGAGRLTLGPARGAADDACRSFFEGVFCGSYSANFEHDMRWWLVCHAVSVLPFCYLAYRLDCDLTRATAADISQLTDAIREGYAAVAAAGGMVLPEDDEDFLEGPGRVVWEGGLRVAFKTAIGRLCVTDHCRNAVAEMRAMDEATVTLLDQAHGVPRHAWDTMRDAMPPWDELQERWGS